LWRSTAMSQEWGADSRRQALNIARAAVASTLVLAGISVLISALPRNRVVSSQHDNFYQTVFQGCFQFRREPFDWRHWTKEVRTDSVDHADWLQTRETLRKQSPWTGLRYRRPMPGWAPRECQP